MSTKPQHLPQGDPCKLCDLRASIHRQRKPRNPQYVKDYNHAHPRVNPSARIIGIDGEGQGRRPHRYNYIAACDEFGSVWSERAEINGRLTTVQCLNFILGLPRRALVFGYAFVYDLTKILTDLPNKVLHLFHEERRARIVPNPKGGWRVIYTPVRWKHYHLNFMNRRLSVTSHDASCASFKVRKQTPSGPIYAKCDCTNTRRCTVWDIFRFFGEKFTEALIKWKIADPEHLKRMQEMKEARGKEGWDKLPAADIEAYCNEECLYLAKLGRALLTAHAEADLKLTQYYGAGSTASALLTKMDVLRYRGDFPDEMRKPLACAFFGGRFENSVVGAVKGPVYNYDISSAYPYQATLLPCLMCGRWEFVDNGRMYQRIEDSTLALINWSFGTKHRSNAAWGMFPVRAKDGTIAFPLTAEGGWTWKQEYFAAQLLDPNVGCVGAWVYNTDCDHKPFGMLPEIYRERVRWGKDAKGIVLKLGPNSVYGKVAQSRGLNPPFQSWIWAGNITSGCRAQLLDALRVCRDPWNVLMFATDGVWSRERLRLPRPIDTGTGDLEKPLGGWEEKGFAKGVFAVRPGIYFPLSPTDEQIKEVRARGLGKRVLYECHASIVKAYQAGKAEVTVAGVERFMGALSSVSYNGKATYKRSQDYGEWIRHPIKVSFNPNPKRRRVLPGGRLELWNHLPKSVPYSKAMVSPDALIAKMAQQIADEQPDADFGYQELVEVTT